MLVYFFQCPFIAFHQRRSSGDAAAAKLLCLSPDRSDATDAPSKKKQMVKTLCQHD